MSLPVPSPSLAAKTRRALEGPLGFIPLEPHEERALARRARDGDASARWALVTANAGFVRSMAQRYLREGIEVEDLVSEGLVGLFEAAERFDPERGIKFITYGSWWVKRSMLRLLRLLGQAVHVPKYKQHQLHEFWRVHARLSQELGRAPDVGELCAHFQATPVEIQELLGLSSPVESVDEASSERPAPRAASTDPEEAAVLADALDRLEAALAELPERSRHVVTARHGLDGLDRRTLAALGEELGLTKERVRQIEHAARRRLRASVDGTGGGSQPPQLAA